MAHSVLGLTADLPERTLAVGEVLYAQGEVGSASVVLVEGDLLVDIDGNTVDRYTQPGTIIGELAALLHQPRAATVTAMATTVVREIAHPEEVFAEQPALALELARQLAGRLHRLQTYIGEVQRQFADRDDHLAMFGEVLGRIAANPAVELDGGSDRSPDY